MNKPKLNGISYVKNGWTYISIWGSPYDRGYAYGYYSASDFKKIQTMLNYYVYEASGRHWDFYITVAKDHFKHKIKSHFPEVYEELEGITQGCIANGVNTNIDEIIAWNNYITIFECWYPWWLSTHSGSSSSGNVSSGRKEGGGGGEGSKDRCSGFIATGDYTTDGKIVVGHNSFVEFIDGQFYKIILDINPTKGNRILMQTCACCIWSGTDFFVTSAGIIGTETTIGGFIAYEDKDPISCRIRQAMQYGNTLNDYVKILLNQNSGDYANAWLLGNIHTNEIMRFELGLKYWDVQTTKNGYYYGCNFAFSPEIRNFECVNTGYCDIRRHQGARQVRIPELIEKYKGKINVNTAIKIISDHYDVYLNKQNPCSRTICSHYELDAREFMSDPSRPKPFSPRGAIDGVVADANMIKNMSFKSKYGSSCNIPFNATKFCNKHTQWKHLEPYLLDRPIQPWTLFTIYNNNNTKNKTKKNIKQKYI